MTTSDSPSSSASFSKAPAIMAWALLMLVMGVNCSSVVPDDYDKTIAPRGKDGGPVEVSFGMKINGIHEVDEITMTVLLEVFFRVSWTDTRLVLPVQVNSSSMTFPLSTSIQKDLWLPDPYIERAREVTKLNILQDFQGIWISGDQSIYTSTMLYIKLGCTMNFALYPFDEQSCDFLVSSYIYTEDAMVFSWMTSRVGIDRAVEKQLANYIFTLKVHNKTMCDCYKCIPAQLPCVRLTLVFARKYFAHVLATFVPSALFVLVAWVSLFWPPEVIPGRTVLVITSLLTIISMYAAFRGQSPQTSYTKALDVWMQFCVIMICCAVFEYAVIIMLKRKQDEARNTEVRPLQGPLKPSSYTPGATQGMVSSHQSKPTTKTIVSTHGPADTLPTGQSLPAEHTPIVALTTSTGATQETTSPSSAQASKLLKQMQDQGLSRLDRLLQYEYKTERATKIMIPLIFLVFNCIYWPFYLSRQRANL